MSLVWDIRRDEAFLELLKDVLAYQEALSATTHALLDGKDTRKEKEHESEVRARMFNLANNLSMTEGRE